MRLLLLAVVATVLTAVPAQADVRNLPDSLRDTLLYPLSADYWTGFIRLDTLSGVGYKATNEIWYSLAGIASLGWAKFDLSPLYDRSTIVAANMVFHQNWCRDTAPLEIRHVRRDPIEEDYPGLFVEIHRAGEVVSETKGHAGIGWFEQSLNPRGVALIESCLTRDWIAFGFNGPDASGRGAADGYRSLNPPALRVTYIPGRFVDVEGVRTWVATPPLAHGEHDTIAAQFYNRGDTTAYTVRALARKNGVILDTLMVDSLAPGETTTLCLDVVPSSAPTAPTYSFISLATMDHDRANDTTSVTDWVFPAGTYRAEGFEEPWPPIGWTTLNLNGGNCWTSSQASAHFGDWHAACHRDSASPNDDWLISDYMCPDPHRTDSIGFYIIGLHDPAAETIEVWALASQAVQDTLAMLLATRALSSTIYTRRSVCLDRFDGRFICVGFRYGSRTRYAAYLDDIYFVRRATGGTKEEPSELSGSGLSIEPNPATGRMVTIRFSLPGPGMLPAARFLLSVHDAAGRCVGVWRPSPQTDVTPLDVSSLPSGVYLVRLRAGGLTATQKLVIQR